MLGGGGGLIQRRPTSSIRGGSTMVEHSFLIACHIGMEPTKGIDLTHSLKEIPICSKVSRVLV